jgi:hypothetical protein
VLRNTTAAVNNELYDPTMLEAFEPSSIVHINQTTQNAHVCCCQCVQGLQQLHGLQQLWCTAPLSTSQQLEAAVTAAMLLQRLATKAGSAAAACSSSIQRWMVKFWHHTYITSHQSPLGAPAGLGGSLQVKHCIEV